MNIPAGEYELVCEGLDYSGWILIDRKIIAEFRGADRVHIVHLLLTQNNKPQRLEIIFDSPPRFLGQFGRTTKMSVGKSRYYYTWDWVPRTVQTGITGPVILRSTAAKRVELEACTATGNSLFLRGRILNGENICVSINDGECQICAEIFTSAELEQGIKFSNLAVEPWLPNGMGKAKLYELDMEGQSWQIGFRQINWKPCRNAPPAADPWICEVNGIPVFIQGINWTPIRPNYADVTREDYRNRLEKYRNLGINLIRLWGGAVIEKECLYELCDELGIMVWQEFPMSSSGLENIPPDDQETMDDIIVAAQDYLSRLITHPSLIAWCGGNELQRGPNGKKCGCGHPCSIEEPLLARLAELVKQRDPGRRFLPASSSGPRFCADEKEFGMGLHWDVHGPWKVSGVPDTAWRRYWENDDALFRSEIGCPGTSPAAMIRQYAGNAAPFPIAGNPLWNYPLPWWNENSAFVAEFGREPESLEEYVTWNQQRQAQILCYIIATEKRRFPECGGVIIWMGHDCFPMTSSPALLDFNGEYKPAALALREIFLQEPPTDHELRKSRISVATLSMSANS